jgi:hypothetical protein
MAEEITERFDGDSRKAMDFLAAALTTWGFRIEEITDSTLHAVGTGVFAKQNSMIGVSKLEIAASGGSLLATAELNGTKAMFRLIVLTMLAGMAVMEIIFLFVPMRGQHGQLAGRWVAFIPLAVFSPWAILIPLMYRFLRNRARRCIQTLLHCAAVTAAR